MEKHSLEIIAALDQEATTSVMARLAIHQAETCYARDVIRWLDNESIHFASKFRNCTQEDPWSFHLSANFSLYPHPMYHLKRSFFFFLYFAVRSTNLGGGDDRSRDWVVMEATVDWPNLPWPSDQVLLPLDDTAWVRGLPRLVGFHSAIHVLD